MARVPYNKLLTNLASSSRTGEYWPSVVFVQTSLGSVRTATTSGQYSPVRPSRSVSKRLLSTLGLHITVQGVKLTFFSSGHLAPKYFKVVANSKKLVAIMTHTHKSAMKYKPAKFAQASKRTLKWVIYNVKGYLNPRWRQATLDLRSKSFMCCVLETSLTRNFAASLSLQIFNNH